MIIVLLFIIFRSTTRSVRVDKDKIQIEQVVKGDFNDYINLTGQVAPISTIFLDAIEGGRVERILIEEGAMVKKDDCILVLSNTNLNLTILNSEDQLAEKSNSVLEMQIRMEQQKMEIDKSLLQMEFDLKAKERTYLINKALLEEDLIPKQDFLLSRDQYELAQRSFDLLNKKKTQDSLFRNAQTSQISLNLKNMKENLELVRKRGDYLNIKAPVDGQLGMLKAEIGQSVNAGQRLGQINVLTSYKIEAKVEEHYVDRVKTGLTAQFIWNDKTYNIKVKKVYPDVREGQFTIDMIFEGELPENMRTGQTYSIRLQLGLPSQCLLLPRAGFFQATGGQWIFVLEPGGGFAIKRNIKIGRQNPQYYEVLEGLIPGDKVITSSYDIFGDNDKVIFK
jgi:HlyD family secretion protein